VTVDREFPGSLSVNTDRHKVLQVLISLVSNAKYAMDGQQDRRMIITIGQENRFAFIRAKDAGSGVSPANPSRRSSHAASRRSRRAMVSGCI
jgi:C4-dicarboxylate-specific signal transduction histidine kinase